MTRAPEPASRSRMRARLCSRAARSTSTHAGRNAASRSSTPGPPSASGGTSERGARFHAMPVEVAEAGGLAEEDELDGAGLAVAVLGDDQLREPLVLL